MVQLDSSFPSTDGRPPPFQGWRAGVGMGKVCRSYINDPTVVRAGRSSPAGDGYYRENRLWKGKWEKDRISSFSGGKAGGPASSKGERDEDGNIISAAQIKELNKPLRSKFAGGPGPQAYGDVSKKLNSAYKSVIYESLKIKPRFPSIQQKIAANPRFSGPGPAKYDTRFKAGDTGWSKGSKNPKWAMGLRIEDNVAQVEQEGKPGPGYYNVSGKPGSNYPIKFGTLYNIQHIGERLPDRALLKAGNQPGPGQYRVKSMFD